MAASYKLKPRGVCAFQAQLRLFCGNMRGKRIILQLGYDGQKYDFFLIVGTITLRFDE